VCIADYDRIYGTVTVPGHVTRVIGLGFQSHFGFKWDETESDNPGVIVADDGDKPLIFEGVIFSAGLSSPVSILNHSKRTIILKDILGKEYRNTSSGGEVFMQNVDLIYVNAKNQNIWMRSFNPERSYGKPYMTNDGGKWWIMGFKTEDYGIIMTTLKGGFTEIIGGLIRVGSQEVPANMPAFKVVESSLSVAGVGQYHNGGQYQIVVEETRDGETKTLHRDNTSGFAQNITAYKDGSGLPLPNKVKAQHAPMPHVGHINGFAKISFPDLQQVFLYDFRGRLLHAGMCKSFTDKSATRQLRILRARGISRTYTASDLLMK